MAFLAAALVLFAPGLALLAWLPERPAGRPARSDVLCVLADGVGLSAAVSALAALLLFLAGARLTPPVVAILYGLCLAALAAWLLTRQRVRSVNLIRWLPAALFVAAAAAALLALRFAQSQGLALPPWVDSVHHVLITRKIMEWGGLPPDLTPYAPVPLVYHYGFHLIAALFAGWAGMLPDQAVLWLGQVINALAALSVYRAAYTFALPTETERESGKAVPAAVMAGCAALLTGFVSQMPAYYLSWGRYTLLTGLLLLGPAISAALDLRHDPSSRAAGIRLALLTAGLCLVHYFALLLAGLFLVVLGVWELVRLARRRASAVRASALWPMIGWTLLGVLPTLPWLWHVMQIYFPAAGVRINSPIGQDEAALTGAVDYLKYTIYLIGPRHNHILMGVALAGMLLGLRRANLRPLIAWGLLLALLSLPWGARIGPFRPDHYAIVLFFPAVILVADLISAGALALARRALYPAQPPARLWIAVTGAVMLLFLIWGVRETRQVINPVTVFGSSADRSALDWVNANTPPDARFFINTVRWQSDTYRGMDGGYWLLPYTGRQTILPPVVYTWGDPAYVQQINRFAEAASRQTGCGPEFWNLAREAELTHIYIKQGQGALQPNALADCSRLRLVYQQDGVFIYEIPRP